MEKNFEPNINNNPEKKNKEMRPISELIIEEMARIVEDMDEKAARERIGSDNYDRVQEYKKEKENRQDEEINNDKENEDEEEDLTELQKSIREDRKDREKDYPDYWEKEFGGKQ